MEAAPDLAGNRLILTRIGLEVYVDDAGGIVLFGRFGVEIEGTHRCYAFCDGAFVDAYFMARIRS